MIAVIKKLGLWAVLILASVFGFRAVEGFIDSYLPPSLTWPVYLVIAIVLLLIGRKYGAPIIGGK